MCILDNGNLLIFHQESLCHLNSLKIQMLWTNDYSNFFQSFFIEKQNNNNREAKFHETSTDLD